MTKSAHKHVPIRRVVAIIGTTLMVLLAGSGPALAAPTVKEKKAQAAKLQDQLERQGARVSVLAEKYNRARLQVSRLEASMVEIEAEVARSDERVAQVKDVVAEAAVAAYVHGGSNAMLSSLARSGDNDLIVRRQYLRVAMEDQRNTLGELRLAKEDLGEHRSRLSEERDQAKTVAGQANDLQREAAEAEASLNRVLGKVNGEVASLVTAEQARREAAEAARRRALATQSRSAPAPTSAPAPAPAPAATPTVNPAATKQAVGLPAGAPASARGAAAVAEARKHLGKPYRYGGSGPNDFDCSGLTGYAWRAAGVQLSHSALAQWHETTRVPVDQVAPGDLLFFGPSVSGIHHNAIYIGDGQMIEASQTGTPVRIRGWRSGDLLGAGRPG